MKKRGIVSYEDIAKVLHDRKSVAQGPGGGNERNAAYMNKKTAVYQQGKRPF